MGTVPPSQKIALLVKLRRFDGKGLSLFVGSVAGWRSFEALGDTE
jgi:hypothetical protein